MNRGIDLEASFTSPLPPFEGGNFKVPPFEGGTGGMSEYPDYVIKFHKILVSSALSAIRFTPLLLKRNYQRENLCYYENIS